MKAYLSVFIGKMKVLLQYREAAIAGMATQIFWGVIRIFIFAAFYRSTKEIQPLSFPEVVTYVWLVQATFRLVPLNVDPEIQMLIRTGTVGYELIRPLDLYFFWFSRTAATKLAPTLLRFLPVFLLSALFLGLRPPVSIFALTSWLIVTFFALLLSTAITNLMNISLLWTITGDGIVYLLMSSTYLLSGQIIPLALFPDFLKKAVLSLPFAGIVDLPIQFYLGKKSMHDLIPAILFQMGWIILLTLIGRYVLKTGLRKMVVQGG